MAHIRPFQAYRPAAELAAQIAALPYDVYNRQEALEEVQRNPLSFLGIDRAETAFPETVDTYADCVYEKAAMLLRSRIEAGEFIQDSAPCYYLYEQIMDGRHQTGIVGCASIEDYQNNVIRKHENTRADKELDRIRHVDACNAQTGPIFLAYSGKKEIKKLTEEIKAGTPVYDFISEDQITHKVWVVSEEERIRVISDAFRSIPNLYIADGHHRCASAVKVGMKRREEHPGCSGTEEFNYFLSVLFPDDELQILDYNRVVNDLNGYTEEEFLKRAEEHFWVEPEGKSAVKPSAKGEFGLYVKDTWYRLTAREHTYSTDPVKKLDVSILQDYLLAPILDIRDPKTDKRIDFVGGIRGLGELERRVHKDMKAAFSLYPTSIAELFEVADAERLMPPKSTWFEPKLRSGLFIHSLQENKDGREKE